MLDSPPRATPTFWEWGAACRVNPNHALRPLVGEGPLVGAGLEPLEADWFWRSSKDPLPGAGRRPVWRKLVLSHPLVCPFLPEPL